MLTSLGLAAALSAACAIIADWRERKPPIFFLLKPLTTVLIAGIAWMAPDSAYRDWILLGLVLSLAGDVCLMFEGNAAFIGGLSSFLIAHLAFMWAFVQGLDVIAVPWWAFGFVVYGAAFSLVLLPRAGRLKLAVFAYGAILMGMAMTASMRYASTDGASGLLALAGAVLFVISDSALGARKFLGAYAGAQGVILSTYWAAIGLIAASALHA